MNPHGKLASFYRYFYYTGDLPNNLCNYFWGLVLAFMCFPFVWIAMAISRYNKIITFDDTIDTNYDWRASDGKPLDEPIITQVPRNRYKVSSYNRVQTWTGILFTMMVMILGLLSATFMNTHFQTTLSTYINGHALNFLWVTYTLGLITAICIGIFILSGMFLGVVFTYLFESIFPTKTKKILTPEEEEEFYDKHWKELEAKAEYKKLNPSFWTLTWRWVKAKKEKNCPIIIWDYETPKK